MSLLYRTGPMESLRKWFYKPKRDDRSLLAQFFFADDALNMVAAELDSFDGRKDPGRCSILVSQLRHAQDHVLNITNQIMDQVLGENRVPRGYRVKFPEDVTQESLAGQLWFGAECLAAGSSILNRDEESAAMRPLAKALTRSLETVRSLLRDQCLRPRELALSQHDDMLLESLKIFDRLFAEFELCYVSAMVNVKTAHEFEAQELICVLFSESLRRALKLGLLTQEQVDSYDPALMFAVPRLAIVSGLLIYSNGPLSIDKHPDEMSDMFRPFRTLLHKIRSLLWTLDRRELNMLERLLCSAEDVGSVTAHAHIESEVPTDDQYPDIGDFVSKFYADHGHCKELYSQQSSIDSTINEGDYLPDNIEVMTPIIDGLRRLNVDHDSESSRQPSIDTASTDTFQEQKDYLDVRNTRSESSDLSSLRNLSSNGLNMFDPLVINAAQNTEIRLIPDNDLITSLSEQVTEIADRLSSINQSLFNEEAKIEMNHSFSTGDVNDQAGFNGPRNEQLSLMPSTSHGYLIPNAISHEPVVMASLSQNNSAIFNTEDESGNSAILNTDDLPMIIPENINNDILNTSISIANANLSSLLLTNAEYRDLDSTQNDDRVRFMLGYESDAHISAVDSGVSTENTSLDRSPESDQCKDIESEHYMTQNRVLKSPTDNKSESTLENSFSECQTENTVSISYTENAEHQKNEAGSSSIRVDSETINHQSIKDGGEAKKVLQEWGANSEEDELVTINEVIKELWKKRYDTAGGSSQSTSRQKKKKTSKKKRKSKMWPGILLLDSRSSQTQYTPSSLNLEHYMDGSGASTEIADCADDEQIAIALQAQELAARQQVRGKFVSTEDLIHRLFVCIAGVADQLQTNFAADLRNILKSVFLMNQTNDEEVSDSDSDKTKEKDTIEFQVSDEHVIENRSSFDSVYSAEEVYEDSNSENSSNQSNQSNKSRLFRRNTVNSMSEQATTSERRRSVHNLQGSVSIGDLSEYREVESAPEWVPDIAAPDCMRCAAHFTAFRRRHHCRNCGKVFCASCSSNSIPLPRYGQMKPVRVCDECYNDIAHSCRRQR